MEGVPYGKPWRTVYTKRSAATALYLLVAAAVGGIVVLIGKIDSGRKKVPKPLAWEPFSHRRAMQRIKGEVHKEVWKRSFQIRLRISAPMALQPTSWQFSCMMSPQRKPERSVLSTARSMASASAAMSKL